MIFCCWLDGLLLCLLVYLFVCVSVCVRAPGIAKGLDSNSLRVKGLGEFEILEVALDTSFVEEEEEEKTREHELKGT